MRPRIDRTIVGYILAGIAMLILFLYLRFPGKAAMDYIKATAVSRYPRLTLSMDSVEPAIPPGLVLENVVAGFRDRPEATIHAERFGVRPGWLSLFRGGSSLLMTAEGYDGRILGRLDFANVFSIRGPLAAEIDVRGIRIEKCKWLQDVLTRQITGTLSGTASFSGAPESLKNGTASIDLTLRNGTYHLAENLFGLERIDFNEVDARMIFRNNTLKIADLILKGEKLRISLKGNILLADDIRQSRIDLNGSVELPIQGNRRAKLAISGTLGNPRARFL